MIGISMPKNATGAPVSLCLSIWHKYLVRVRGVFGPLLWWCVQLDLGFI